MTKTLSDFKIEPFASRFVKTFEHFTLSEFFAGCESFEIIDALRDKNVFRGLYFTAFALTEIRRLNGDKPIIINSCYRSKKHNFRVGGVPNSQHLYALAVDIKRDSSIYKTLKEISDSPRMMDLIGIRQLIFYPNFIHVGFYGYRMFEKPLLMNRVIHND